MHRFDQTMPPWSLGAQYTRRLKFASCVTQARRRKRRRIAACRICASPSLPPWRRSAVCSSTTCGRTARASQTVCKSPSSPSSRTRFALTHLQTDSLNLSFCGENVWMLFSLCYIVMCLDLYRRYWLVSNCEQNIEIQYTNCWYKNIHRQ